MTGRQLKDANLHNNVQRFRGFLAAVRQIHYPPVTVGRCFEGLLMPQRFLRPGIRNSARWNSVSRTAQVLYVGILTLVDDYGQFDGRVSVIHGECFSVWNDFHQDNPQESAATRCALQELAAASMIEIWTNKEGKLVMEVTQWQERVREGAKRKWGIRRNPQESAGIRSAILPPPPPPPPPPSPSPSPSSAPPPNVVVSSDCAIAPEKEPEAGKTDAKAFFAKLRKDIASEPNPEPVEDRSIEAFKGVIGTFLKRSKTSWSYDEEYLAAEVVRRDWVSEWKEIRRYLDDLPDNKRQFEPALRGFKKLITEWSSVLDRARMINNSDKHLTRELDRIISNAKRI